MSGIVIQPGVTTADLQAATAGIPQPASAAPMAEKTGAAIGQATTRYALEDHQHPRLTSTTYATLDSTGKATVSFSRTFVNKPGINLTETDAIEASQPLVLRGLSWVRDANGLYTGVTVQGSRAQLMPTLTPVSGVLSLISGVIGAVNTNVITPLSGFNIFGATASGATVSVIAVARSDVSSS